jgi:DNA-binding transcriptional regulator GbsR (MarR family)
MELNEKTQGFVEKLGLMFERMGFPKTKGRLMGLLLVADGPLSLTEMAEILQVSKASMSTNTRSAEQMGWLQRASIPGDRRAYYEITPGSFEGMLGQRFKAMVAIIHLIDEGLDAIDPDNATARVRLAKMKDFYEFFLAEMHESLDRWHDHERKSGA